MIVSHRIFWRGFFAPLACFRCGQMLPLPPLVMPLDLTGMERKRKATGIEREKTEREEGEKGRNDS